MAASNPLVRNGGRNECRNSNRHTYRATEKCQKQFFRAEAHPTAALQIGAKSPSS